MTASPSGNDRTPNSRSFIGSLVVAESIELDGVYIGCDWVFPAGDDERLDVPGHGNSSASFYLDDLERAVFDDSAWRVQDSSGATRRMRLFMQREITDINIQALFDPINLLQTVDDFIASVETMHRDRNNNVATLWPDLWRTYTFACSAVGKDPLPCML